MKEWKALTRPSKVATILSVTAIFVTIVNAVINWQQVDHQNDINSGIATFSAGAQSTSVAQFQQQIELQNTQIAMQDQMDQFTKWQMLPLVRVANQTEPVLILRNVIVDAALGENLIVGSGVISIILANDGGGGASLIDIKLANSSDGVTLEKDFSIEAKTIYEVGRQVSMQPMQIEGQSPVRLDVTIDGRIGNTDDVQGKSSLELGMLWRNRLQDANLFLEFIFSNADKVAVPLSNVSLNVQFQGLANEITGKAERLKILQRIYDSIRDKSNEEAKSYSNEIQRLQIELYGLPPALSLDELKSKLEVLQQELDHAQQNLNVALEDLEVADRQVAAGNNEALQEQLKLQEEILRLEQKRMEQMELLQAVQKEALLRKEEQLRRQTIIISYAALFASVLLLGLVIRFSTVKKRERTAIMASPIELVSLSPIRIGENAELKVRAKLTTKYTPFIKSKWRRRRFESKTAEYEGEILSWVIPIQSNTKPGKIKLFMEHDGYTSEIGNIEIRP